MGQISLPLLSHFRKSLHKRKTKGHGKLAIAAPIVPEDWVDQPFIVVIESEENVASPDAPTPPEQPSSPASSPATSAERTGSSSSPGASSSIDRGLSSHTTASNDTAPPMSSLSSSKPVSQGYWGTQELATYPKTVISVKYATRVKIVGWLNKKYPEGERGSEPWALEVSTDYCSL